MTATPADAAQPLPAPFLDELRALLGDRLSTADDVRREHAKDVSHHHPLSPQAVVFPESDAEVAAVVRACSKQDVPLVPFGTGTAVEGGVVATRGGLCLDTSRMNRILRFSQEDMDVTVQAGVTRHALNRDLDERGTNLFFPVDPGADAALGGMAATCASGSAAVRYGTMRDNVLGLTVVLASGETVHTGGRARKSSAGYDLTRLFVGSEGTLGVITAVTLRLHRKPEAVSAAVCPFASVEAAVACAIDVLGHGVPVARMELLDDVQIAAVNAYSDLDNEVTPTLFFEFHGTRTGVEEQARLAERIAGDHGAAGFRWATDEAERNRLWQARHDAYFAALALRENGAGYVTDVCVPVSRLAEAIARTRELLVDVPFPAPLFGHVGDGNFHVVGVIDPESECELAAARRLSDAIVDLALELDGTCTGEHGIGLGKLDALEREAGPALGVMRAVKQALDPRNLMNPGKVLRAARVEG